VAAPQPPRLSVHNVLLLTVDTLRADQSWTGYDGANTPNLHRLAESGVVYTRAYTMANTTAPSLGALLSARYPTELSRDNCPLAGLKVDQGLARVIADAGFHTMASHGHALFASSTAPSDGFKDWKLIRGVGGRRQVDGAITGGAVADNLIELLQETPKERRSFTWVHFVDPHHSYASHGAFPKRGSGNRAAYNAEVEYTDHHIGRVLDTLEQLGLREKTAIVLTADHGEAFGEHGTVYHGYSLYEEEVRVPLVLSIPGVPPRRITTPRSLIDVPRTIAELLSIPAPEVWRGVSLLRDLEGEAPAERQVLVDCPELMSAAPKRAWISGNKKVIFERGLTRAFDLEADPGEKNPLPEADAASWIDAAKSAFGALNEVPFTPCARQAYVD
jgi:choline-sulfatase